MAINSSTTYAYINQDPYSNTGISRRSVGVLFFFIVLLAICLGGLAWTQKWGTESTDSRLSFHVSQGWVRIEGSVPHSSDRRRLILAASMAFGESRVIDDMRVERGARAWIPDEQAGRVMSVLASLKDNATLQFLPDGRSRLKAEVPNRGALLAAESELRGLRLPVERLDLDLRVVAKSDGPNQAPAVAQASEVSSPVLAVAPGPDAKAPPGVGATPWPAACGSVTRGIRISFVPGQAALSPAAGREVDALVPCMASATSWQVHVHTDSNGDEAANVRLTQARAELVADALVKRGVARERLLPRGMGSSIPIADNATREGRLQNRRVTLEPVSPTNAASVHSAPKP